MGIPELNALRGYKTPAINEFAREGMRFARMYTEPSCTPTRVAFMTGRQPHRNGMGDDRDQKQTLEQLRELAGKDEPFFLEYWPLYPLSGPRTTTDPHTTPNGGNYVEKMKLLDEWIGEIMDEMDEGGVRVDAFLFKQAAAGK